MHSEPIRHHYIPQFILRNFCFEGKRLHYYDKQTGSISLKETRDVFMVRNLYRDEINCDADPVKIEKDLAKYKQEVAQIINGRFLNERDIVLSFEEEEKLRLFFAIMGFRSHNTWQCFGEKVSKQSKVFYRQYQRDGNTLDMWKRNLGHIVQCRSLEKVLRHPDIDEPFKVFFLRDTVGYFGKYIAVAEVNDENAFVIGDAYPVAISGIRENGLSLIMYEIFPISSKRVLFMVNNGVQGVPRDVLELRHFILQPPYRAKETNMLRIRVRKLCTDEVQYLNGEIAKTAQLGFAFLQSTYAISSK